MRILIADRQMATRSALGMLLGEEPSFKVVGEAADGRELLTQLDVTCPDLVLLEWELPGGPAVGLLDILQGHHSRPCVMVISGRPELKQAALAAGADVFVSKGDPPKQLVDAIHAIRSRAGYKQ